MNRFIEKLPAHYKSLSVQLKSTERELSEQEKIAEPDNYDYHDCDCEYCPVPEAQFYTSKEREDAQEQVEELQQAVNEYKSTINAIKRYAKVMHVELEVAEVSK